MDTHTTIQALNRITELAAAIMLADASEHDAKQREAQAVQPRVQALIEHSLATKNVVLHVEDVSDKLGMASATLRRRLALENTGFQAILDEARFKLAKTLLSESPMTIDDIASALDFSASSGFSRAFSAWSGTSPARYRRQHIDPDKVTLNTRQLGVMTSDISRERKEQQAQADEPRTVSSLFDADTPGPDDTEADRDIDPEEVADDEPGPDDASSPQVSANPIPAPVMPVTINAAPAAPAPFEDDDDADPELITSGPLITDEQQCMLHSSCRAVRAFLRRKYSSIHR